MAYYNLKSESTGEIVAFTKTTPYDSEDLSEEEVLEARIWAAIEDGWIPGDSYKLIKTSKKGCKGTMI